MVSMPIDIPYHKNELKYKEYLEEDPNNVIYNNKLGKFYMAEHRYEEAKIFFRLSIENEKDNYFIEARIDLAKLYYLTEDYFNSMVYCYEIIRFNPNISEAYNIMGLINLTYCNNLIASKLYFQKAVDLDPDNLNAKNNLKLSIINF